MHVHLSICFLKRNIDYFLLKHIWLEQNISRESTVIIFEIRSISRPNNRIYRTHGIEVVEKTLAISGSRLRAKIICNVCKCIHTIARVSRRALEGYDYAIATQKQRSARLQFGEESSTKQRKTVCEGEKKTRVSSRPRRQISRGTSSTVSLCDALCACFRCIVTIVTIYVNFRFK